MQRRRKSPPSYRLHRPSGQAVVRLNGKDHYLGKHGTRESRDAYDRLIAEWLACGRVLPNRAPAESPPAVREGRRGPRPPAPSAAPTGPLVKEALLAYLEHAAVHYRRPDGTPTGELDNMIAAVRPVRDLYGSLPIAEFESLKLRAVREAMIGDGLCRDSINARINRVRRFFTWAASRKLVPAAVALELRMVEPLQPGRSAAPERPPVRPVPIEQVEATLTHLNPVVRAMVSVQLLSGCRAGEVAVMRPCDLTMSGPNWEYRPRYHKTAWRGKSRVIPIGPRAQEVIGPYLDRAPTAYLFDPREAVAGHHAGRGERRRTKRTPSEIARRKASPGDDHADHYDRRTYRQAVVRACDRAFPHPELSKIRPKDLTAEQRAELGEWRKRHRWSPLRLRHTAGTRVRSLYGFEAAQNHLGHDDPDATRIYAERDLGRAHQIAAEIA